MGVSISHPINICRSVNLENFMKYFIILVLAITLTGCKDSNDKNTEEGDSWPPFDDTTPATNYGHILDSEVEGIRYISGTHYGTTDSNGTFGYIQGEYIQFYIGDIKIGSPIVPDIRLTPYELANKNSSAALNIASFLQTLDNDADLGNGIQINESIHHIATENSYDFPDDEWEYLDDLLIENSSIVNFIYELTSGTEAGSSYLISQYGAYEHFSTTLDNLADEVESDLINLASLSTCDSESQCRDVELISKDQSYCPEYGTTMTYSDKDINKTLFDSLISKREYVVGIKSHVSTEVLPNVSGICMRLPRPQYNLVCNNSNRCEIQY
jgi:hypothetical protein